MRRFFARAEAAAPPPWPTGDPDVGDTYAALMQADYSHEDAIDAVVKQAWLRYYERYADWEAGPRVREGVVITK